MNATASGPGHDSHGLGWVLQLSPPPRVDKWEEHVEHFPEYCASAPEQRLRWVEMCYLHGRNKSTIKW